MYMGLLNLFGKYPYVYTLHIAPVPSDIIHRLLTFTGYRTIAISNEVKDFLVQKLKVNPERIALVLNGVNERLLMPLSPEEKFKVRKQFGISEDKIVVSIHARISVIKNQISVAHAVASLTEDERRNIIILCSGEIGGPTYNDIINVIKSNGIEDNFVFCGWASAREVIGCSDYTMLPSTSEGFPLNCLEAMFLKVPVLRTKTGGYENMSPYCVGMEEPTVDCIAEHLRKIIEKKLDISYMVNKAEKFAHTDCTISQMTRKTVEVYKDCICQTL